MELANRDSAEQQHTEKVSVKDVDKGMRMVLNSKDMTMRENSALSFS